MSRKPSTNIERWEVFQQFKKDYSPTLFRFPPGIEAPVDASAVIQPSDMPDGWEVAKDENGEFFFVDHKTGISSWNGKNKTAFSFF